MKELTKRLDALIENDKKINTEKIKSVLKSDFFYLISNYFEVEFDSIKVGIDLDGKGYNISVNARGDNIKFVRSIPE